MMCDVWCMMYDVWCMMYDVWCMMYDVWCMVYDVWCMMYDVWYMMYDVWCMMYDVWCMMYDVGLIYNNNYFRKNLRRLKLCIIIRTTELLTVMRCLWSSVLPISDFDFDTRRHSCLLSHPIMWDSQLCNSHDKTHTHTHTYKLPAITSTHTHIHTHTHTYIYIYTYTCVHVQTMFTPLKLIKKYNTNTLYIYMHITCEHMQEWHFSTHKTRYFGDVSVLHVRIAAVWSVHASLTMFWTQYTTTNKYETKHDYY